MGNSQTRDAGGDDAGEGLREGDWAEVEVERILPGGLGLAHAGGETILVALSAPGDRARVRIRTRRGKTLFAGIEELLAPGPARVEPPCPYFGRCGGCDFQQLTYAAQLEAKSEIIRDCLRRVARIEEPPRVEVVASPIEWRYRSRAQWQHDALKRHLGYFERGTHDVCDVVECPVVLPPLQGRLTRLRGLMSEGELPEGAREFEAVTGDGGEVSLAPPLDDADAAEQELTVGGERYRFDASCFFQINHALLGPLIEEATRDATGDAALDLYCGVGLFTLPLARRFREVTGVEGSRAAARFARRNLAGAGLVNARVETSGVGAWLASRAARLVPLDFVLLDPPRAGAEKPVIEVLTKLRPRSISYVSCDPATLARDLRALIAAGYALDTVRAFDLFPQTHHVETVARLSL
ncbi:MAG TPA: RsmD family RNA methyltransferase [Pyrinomonadaceae bacterium]|nr:RsmD family RNA methyltransferase [Pyrinomonadaceae bacterium]